MFRCIFDKTNNKEQSYKKLFFQDDDDDVTKTHLRRSNMIRMCKGYRNGNDPGILHCT